MEQIDRLFEISFETCNKVGGIYTVIKTKAKYVVEKFKGKYMLVGFYNKEKAKVEFDEEKNHEFKEIFENLKSKNIICHYGRWNIEGKPRVILIESSDFMKNLNEIKKELWEKYRVDSLFSHYTFDEVVVWGYCVGILLENLYYYYKNKGEKNFIAHFHEWISGSGMLYLKSRNIPIKCIFMTHATVAGRAMTNAGINLYDKIENGIKNKEILDLQFVRNLGIIEKHTLEKACADNCDLFVTVSEITAKEAEYCLGKKVNFILPNGIDIEENIGIEELTLLRRKYGLKTREFLYAYFSRYYYIDMEKIRSLFISGRYEFRNKGIDIFIKALGKLNRELKEERKNKKFDEEIYVIAFLFIPADNYGENKTVMENIISYEEIKKMIDKEIPTIKDKILKNIINGKIYTSSDFCKDIFTEDFLNSCRYKYVSFSELKSKNAPIITHDLKNLNDKILNALKSENLLNREEDVVKVIYFPEYLSPENVLIGLSYEETILTFDIGIFPSYYEPWGYTPLETAKHGVITITTDLN
ncbi:MAG: hypothetical protein ACK4YO_02605, partial [Candidatus Altarchaeaceae archaeon]